MVAHALELVGDTVKSQEEPQVAGHRGLSRDGHRHQGRDCALDLVDLPVRGDHLLRQRRIPVHQRVMGSQDLLLDQRTHAQHAVLDPEHLGVEALAHAGRMTIGGRGRMVLGRG